MSHQSDYIPAGPFWRLKTMGRKRKRGKQLFLEVAQSSEGEGKKCFYSPEGRVRDLDLGSENKSSWLYNKLILMRAVSF